MLKRARYDESWIPYIKKAVARNVTEYGYTQADTAKLFGITPQDVWRYVEDFYGVSMRNRRSARIAGANFEGAVAYYLGNTLHKPIERRVKHGKNDMGDIAGVTTYDGLECIVECKNEHTIHLSEYLTESAIERQNAGAYASFVVFKRDRIGISKESPLGRHCVAMNMGDFGRIIKLNRTNEKDIAYGVDGMVIGYTKFKYSGKYDIEGAMKCVESNKDSGCDAHVVIHEMRSGESCVLTTLHDIAKILSYKKNKMIIDNINIM